MRSQGGALIEVLVALVVLASAGVSTVSFLIATLDSVARSEAREARFVQAERVLSAASLLDRADLDLRMGSRLQGDMLLLTSRPEPDLYRLAVADTMDPQREILVTVVHRPSGERHVP